jgi:hypothetical protein
MIVFTKHASCSAKASLERTKEKMARVISFLVYVLSSKTKSQRTTLEIAKKYKPEFDLQVGYFKQWIPITQV